MKTNLASEALFWKHLVDTLLDTSGVDRKKFYKKVEVVKSIWDIEDLHRMSPEIMKASHDRTKYIKDNFKDIITDLKK